MPPLERFLVAVVKGGCCRGDWPFSLSIFVFGNAARCPECVLASADFGDSLAAVDGQSEHQLSRLRSCWFLLFLCVLLHVPQILSGVTVRRHAALSCFWFSSASLQYFSINYNINTSTYSRISLSPFRNYFCISFIKFRLRRW